MDKEEKFELSLIKKAAHEKIKALEKNSEWSVLQQIAQDIEAYYILKNQKSLSNPELVRLLEKEVKIRYENDDELRELLLAGIPSAPGVHKWRKKKGWQEAVWEILRGTGLFSQDKRTQIIDALFAKAAKGDTQAAKLWLTMSGDYQDKLDVKSNDTVDKFREINKVLHNK